MVWLLKTATTPCVYWVCDVLVGATMISKWSHLALLSLHLQEAEQGLTDGTEPELLGVDVA